MGVNSPGGDLTDAWRRRLGGLLGRTIHTMGLLGKTTYTTGLELTGMQPGIFDGLFRTFISLPTG
jgi:hypothetical protein